MSLNTQTNYYIIFYLNYMFMNKNIFIFIKKHFPIQINNKNCIFKKY